MSNTYFQFKKFTIHQDKCAMKVCTDACLFGGEIALKIEKLKVKHILDIGTGTGLLSLMLAQKTTANIDAIEIDTNAYQQAKENSEQSIWKESINVYNKNVLQFNADKKYDCIVSNPPFFEDDLMSNDANKNKAKHDTSLTLQQLLLIINNNLANDGIFYVLLPYHRITYFEQEAIKVNLFLSEKILIKQTTTHSYFRGILSFVRKEQSSQILSMSIKDETGNYTDDFIIRLKDYYLYL